MLNDGTKYIGSWMNNKKHGEFTIVMSNETHKIGRFIGGKKRRYIELV